MRTATTEYGFTFEPHGERVQAKFNGVIVADSTQAMVMKETRLPTVYYFPQADVRMDLMSRTDHHTHCPFRGNASYWTLVIGGERWENVLWSYEIPLAEAEHVKGYVAFFENRAEFIGPIDTLAKEHPVVASEDYANPLLSWLVHEATTIVSPKELTESFAARMVEAGFPVSRLTVVLQTLHPELLGIIYRWSAETGHADSLEAPHSALDSPAYLNSPLLPIFEGAGGIRRRLDVPNPVLDFEILQELHAQGATDYVAMPIPFSDGKINVLTLTSMQPGGFTTAHLGNIYEILGLMGRLFEAQAMRRTAATLLDTYLGGHAGERVLSGAIRRGDGEDIEAVIWFCDLRRSTDLAQSMNRQAFLETLNEFFDAMAGAVMEHDGQVLRFIGDAALAIFPITQNAGHWSTEKQCAEDARHQALRAALDAAERIRETNERRRAQNLEEIHFGLALHEGEVTFGNIGTANRLEFTVIGEAANLAARIESMCKTFAQPILLSADFAKHFPGQFVSQGVHSLRGVVTPQEIFALPLPEAAE